MVQIAAKNNNRIILARAVNAGSKSHL
jgi:hypothetical protein